MGLTQIPQFDEIMNSFYKLGEIWKRNCEEAFQPSFHDATFRTQDSTHK